MHPCVYMRRGSRMIEWIFSFRTNVMWTCCIQSPGLELTEIHAYWNVAQGMHLANAWKSHARVWLERAHIHFLGENIRQVLKSMRQSPGLWSGWMWRHVPFAVGHLGNIAEINMYRPERWTQKTPLSKLPSRTKKNRKTCLEHFRSTLSHSVDQR